MRFLTRLGRCAIVPVLAIFVGIGCSDDTSPSGSGEIDTIPPLVSNVTAIDERHVDVTFSEAMSPSSAENTDNYSIEEVLLASPVTEARGGEAGSAAPIGIALATLHSDEATVTLTLYSPMMDVQYNLYVSGVRDASGNMMDGEDSVEFTGTTAPDETAPTIVSRSPAAGATGVATGQPVSVTFSEPMQSSTVAAAFSWTRGVEEVPFSMEVTDETEYTFTAIEPLDLNTLYTITVGSAALDWAGNPLVESTWTFRTTALLDETPPYLVSSVPVNGATNFPTDGSLSLTFSEAIDPTSLDGILISPQPGEGDDEWSNGGKTVTFTPYEPLLDDTQYLLVLPEGSFRDLSGNSNVQSYSIQFTTGSSFETGRINGTISGDPLSAYAADPTGALVVASTRLLFSEEEDGPDVIGVGYVLANGTYSVLHLPDSTYYPFAIMDSNGDGEINPEYGDAIGAFGINLSEGDTIQDAVVIEDGGTANGVDFQLFDPSSISGVVFYDGDTYAGDYGNYPFHVGVFDAATFDPDNPGDPVTGMDGGSLVWDPDYVVSSFDGHLEPGTYYVGAYLDVNYNDSYEPGVDPAGFYSDQSGDPVSITIAYGEDALDIDIHLEDPPAPGLSSRAIAWKSPGEDARGRSSIGRMGERVREILETRK